ncbi:MAG TPA: hydrolase [Lachnospiraceae bacterium]|nr:hydrolase [Lachnospiraceae bacterium]
MRLMAENTMVIVVDYQEKLIPVIYENEKVVANSEILIKGIKEFDIPIIVSQQYTKGLGGTVPAIAEALGDFTPYEKSSFSLWKDKEIKEAIKATGRKNVIICGTEAHICVLQTVIDLRAKDYNVFVVEDCVGSRNPNDKKFACKRAVEEKAFLCTYESVLYELTGGAASPKFKIISKLTK